MNYANFRKLNEIYDANKLVLVSIQKNSCEVVDLGIIKDNYSETKKTNINKIKSRCNSDKWGCFKGKTDKVGKFFEITRKLNFGTIN